MIPWKWPALFRFLLSTGRPCVPYRYLLHTAKPLSLAFANLHSARFLGATDRNGTFRKDGGWQPSRCFQLTALVFWSWQTMFLTGFIVRLGQFAVRKERKPQTWRYVERYVERDTHWFRLPWRALKNRPRPGKSQWVLFPQKHLFFLAGNWST